jgi:hypothetical protein
MKVVSVESVRSVLSVKGYYQLNAYAAAWGITMHENDAPESG